MGKIEYPNGDVYEGELQNDLPHVKGKIIKSIPEFNRIVEYNGDFKNDLRHGKGVIIFNDGTKKECEYKEGKEI